MKKIRILALLLLCIFSLSACETKPTEEETDLLSEGTEKVNEWFENNMEDATVNSYSIMEEYAPRSDTDVIKGDYTVNGETHEYRYVVGSETMYLETLYDDFEDLVIKKYADILELNKYEVYEHRDINIPLTYTSYSNSTLTKEHKREYISDFTGDFLPSDITADNLKEYIEETPLAIRLQYTIKDKTELSDICIDDRLLADIKKQQNFHITVNNKDEMERLDIIDESIDASSPGHKDIIRVSYEKAEWTTSKNGDKYKDFSAYEYYIYDYKTLELLEHKKEK